jgi:protein-S-isoprenylcysteine O-methyltransferase Ste14
VISPCLIRHPLYTICITCMACAFCALALLMFLTALGCVAALALQEAERHAVLWLHL